MTIPFLRPNPPRLSELLQELREIESSGIYTNYGPVNTRLELELQKILFGGEGACLTINNATTGLMLAIRESTPEGLGSEKKYAIMPSFTFAAAAHAAIWAGLTPLFCDITADTWVADPDSEEALLCKYDGQVAIIVAAATFGNNLDIDRYRALAKRSGAAVVMDAAASLGSRDTSGRTFGHASPFPVVYSMHATKAFATAEAGLIYCTDHERISRLRSMGNFGFGEPRTATMPGLNSKLSEVGALLALAKLKTFDSAVVRRAALAKAYRGSLTGWVFQRRVGADLAPPFESVLLPASQAENRDAILSSLRAQGIECARYFSPHLIEHPYFRRTCVWDDLSVTEAIARRIISLPMADDMTDEDVGTVCKALVEATAGR